jgi:endoglucanase
VKHSCGVALTNCAVALYALGCSGFEVPLPVAMGGEAGAGGATLEQRPTQSVCAADDDEPLANDYPRGLHVVGNHIEDAAGTRIFLRGVNRSGSEYRCIQGAGFFDGDCDEASVRAMTTWGINAVRVPLNESCWLGLPGAPPELAGENYQRAVQSYVHLLHKYSLIPILDLHWSRAGVLPATRLDPMPNADNSPSLWRAVALTFAEDTGVIFEPFNEPFPDRVDEIAEPWRCWRDGCTAWTDDDIPEPYQAAGMQELVTSIRETGAPQLILLGGLEYSNDLTEWSAYRPDDPLENLAPAWHVYNFNRCAREGCWHEAPLSLAQDFPIVASEIGQDDCQGDFIGPLMSFLDEHAAGYLAWSWNVHGQCRARTPMTDGNPWPLVSDFATGRANSGYAQTFRDHVLDLTQ